MPHIHDLIDFVVAAYIVHEDKVLLVDHIKIGTWMPIGGHIELDEDTDQALAREIKEECNLDVEIIGGLKPDFSSQETKPLLAPIYLDIHNISDTHKHICLVYFGKAKSDQVVLAEREHHSFRWFTAQELSNPEFNIWESVQFYAQKALDKAGW